MFGMIAKWKTSTAGVERCQLDTRNTKKKRQSRVRIQFLAARATIISNETDEERSGVSYPPYMADSKRKRPEYKEIVITYLRD